MYVYAPAGSVAAPAAAKKPALGKRKGVPAVAAMSDDDEDDDDEDDEEDDDDDDMKWACEVAVMRLVKKAKKEHIALLCGDFGVPVSGNKQDLAENLAEQLHYETDAEEDDE